MSTHIARLLCAVPGALALACGANAARAADWHVDPKITVNAQSDDNHRMTDVPGQEIDVFGAELDGQLTLRAEMPRGSFRLVPRLRSTFYPDDQDEEVNNQYLRMFTEYRGERSRATFDANYARIETLGRYFPGAGVDDDDDLGEPDPGEDISRSTSPNRREQLDVTPEIAFDLTERTGLELGVGYQDVSYDEQVADERQDYSNLDGSVALRFRTSPTKSIAIGVGASRFEPDDGTSTDAHTLTAEWSNQISEISQFFVRGGASRVESADGTGGSDWNTGFTGGAGVRWSFEVTQVFLDVTRQLDPNASGRMVERDQLRFQLRRQVSPLAAIFLSARGIRDGKSTDDDTFQDREYAAAGVGFDWRMTQKFTLGGGYRYAWRKYDGDPNDAASNELYLGITYEPHRP
jgi:opacity protein-like surface antigen